MVRRLEQRGRHLPRLGGRGNREESARSREVMKADEGDGGLQLGRRG